VSERTSVIPYERWFVVLLRNLAVKVFYPKADAIIVNSKGIAIILGKLKHILLQKIAVIYNPVDIEQIMHLSKKKISYLLSQEDVPIIIGIGRLSIEKGHSYLLKAVHIILSKGIQCRLIICGQGLKRERLEKLAVDLKIDDKVTFLGFQDNPYKYLANSTVFVIPSLYEGFPNVLLEAMALGIPSVATRCPTGPDEIITEGVDGILVPPADEKAIADAIKKLLLDEDLRKRLSEAGKRRIQDFAVEKIVKQYEDAIESVCAESAER
jgi:glycosyltransferase involved in cell wall biosynthesis